MLEQVGSEAGARALVDDWTCTGRTAWAFAVTVGRKFYVADAEGMARLEAQGADFDIRYEREEQWIVVGGKRGRLVTAAWLHRFVGILRAAAPRIKLTREDMAHQATTHLDDGTVVVRSTTFRYWVAREPGRVVVLGFTEAPSSTKWRALDRHGLAGMSSRGHDEAVFRLRERQQATLIGLPDLEDDSG